MKIQVCKVANYIHVDDLNHHPANHELRHISEKAMEQLKESIRKKGLYEPLLVWSEDNQVLGGNQRLKAIRELIEEGYSFHVEGSKKKNMIPVVIEDVGEAEAIAILHQANNHQGNWVEEALAKAIAEAESIGVSTADLGYTEEYAKRVLKEAELFEEAKEADEKPHVPPADETKYLLVVEAKDENEFQDLFTEFNDRGMKVRMMS